jgi:nicotinamide riboside kinase
MHCGVTMKHGFRNEPLTALRNQDVPYRRQTLRTLCAVSERQIFSNELKQLDANNRIALVKFLTEKIKI